MTIKAWVTDMVRAKAQTTAVVVVVEGRFIHPLLLPARVGRMVLSVTVSLLLALLLCGLRLLLFIC